MAEAVTIVYQKSGRNFKTTVFNIALTGAYAAPEVVTLTSAASNPSGTTVTGPGGAAKIPPRITLVNLPTVVDAQLVPTATAGQYNLTLNTATGTPFSGNYPANASATVEIDHDLQGF
jgi:hypothetical protein